MNEPVTRYAICPLSPLPKSWRDKHGPIRIMGGPFKGWLMVRRPGCEPFVLRVRHLLNAEPHPSLGPFTVEKNRGKAKTEAAS